MRTIFESGMRPALGQYSWPNPYPNPYSQTVTTPVQAPVVPPPPEIPAEVRKLVDDALRTRILSLIDKAKADLGRVSAWWNENSSRGPSGKVKAEEILGKRFPEYQRHLVSAMNQQSLAETLKWRLGQAGQAYIKDSEIASMDIYGLESQALHDLVFGSQGDPGVATSPEEQLAVLGLVALVSFGAALFL